MTDKIVVINTCASAEEAEKLARKLVDERLAACVTVLPRAKSFYRWKGAVENAAEWVLLIKSSRPLFAKLQSAIEASHTYEIPEILAIPVVEGSTGYLTWLDSELQSADIE